MQGDREFTLELLESLEPLRAFARSLCRDPAQIDDLVQQTALQAWAARRRLRPDTRLRSWLFTVLQNYFYTDLRRRRRELLGGDAQTATCLSLTPDHHVQRQAAEVNRALQALPGQQRDALALIVFRGFSYDETAKICACKAGTIRSRMARAREELYRLLDGG